MEKKVFINFKVKYFQILPSFNYKYFKMKRCNENGDYLLGGIRDGNELG